MARIGALLFAQMIACLCASSASAAEPDTGQRLIEEARNATPEHYRFAVTQHAQVRLTPDGRSFYLLWYPGDPNKLPRPPVIVTLHGHASWAFDEFFLWQPYAAKRGYGILAIQWWFGQGEGARDYYAPQQLYPIVESVLREQRVAPGTVLLHGFSRGAANMYALTAIDRSRDHPFFAMTLANAGGAANDFPPNSAISNGQFGTRPFTGTHWVLFCGGRDEHPDRDGCPAMRRTRGWIEQYGGVIDAFLEDTAANHGGFHQTPATVEATLDAFDRIVKNR